MKKIFYIFLTILFCISITGCNDNKEIVVPSTSAATSITTKTNQEVCFPIDIQIEGGNLGKSYYYRLKSNGIILSKTLDGEYMNLLEDTPKGFDYIRINEDSAEEKIDIESKNRIKSLIFELTKIKTDYYTVDGVRMYVYFNNQVIEVDISGAKGNNKSLYKIFNDIINILNENTSLNIDDKYYWLF